MVKNFFGGWIMVTKEAKEQADELFYRDMIKTLAENLLLPEINDIAYNVMETGHIVVKGKFFDGIDRLEQKIKIALWPKKNKAFEASIFLSVAHAVNFSRLFTKRSGPIARKFDPVQESIEEFNENILLDYCEFYKDYNPKERDVAYKDYMTELEQMSNEFCLLLKSLNWFADIIREEYDPMFFKIYGKFVGNKYNKDSPVEDKYDYTETEKEEIIKQYKQ
jgi:hypothetical protein